MSVNSRCVITGNVKCREYVQKALAFLGGKFKNIEQELDVEIIFTDKLGEISKKISIDKREIPYQVEGIFIPKEQQLNGIQDKIIINTNADKIISRIVHEMVHSIDYMQCVEFYKEFEAKYKKLEQYEARDKKLSAIDVMRTEMRARYFQLEYLYSEDVRYFHAFLEHLKKTDIPDNFNELGYYMGEVQWLQKYAKGGDSGIILNKKNQLINHSRLCKDVFEVYELIKWIEYCNKIFQGN